MKITQMAAALAFVSFTAVAQAQTTVRGDDISIDVQFADLNLSNPMGAEIMLMRIKQAAFQVCGGRPDFRSLHERRPFQSCVRTATGGAVRQLNAPLVTALYTGRPTNDGQLAQR